MPEAAKNPAAVDRMGQMTDQIFGYQAVLKSDRSGRVSSLIAYQAPAQGPLQAVMWHAGRKEWIYAPAIAAGLLFDDTYTDQTMPVDRTTAEALANEHLPSRLPTVETLQEMINEGTRMGWDYGPPRE
jgi:hypothetical protein